MWLRSANAAEQIEVLLAEETLGYLRNILLDRSPNFPHGFDMAFGHLLLLLLFFFPEGIKY